MRSIILTTLFTLLMSAVFARVPFKVEGNSVLIELEGINAKSKLLKVEVWSTQTVRIRSTMKESFDDAPTFLGAQPTAPVKFKAGYAQANLEIAAEGIVINVAEDGIVRILNGVGRKLMVESSRSYAPSEEVPGAYKITQKFYLNKGEHIYGFGQEDLHPRFSLIDQVFDVKQDASSTASPVMYSEKGFALIWNNFSPTHFEEKNSSLSLTSDVADEIDYFIISGPEWKSILSQIRNISGKSPMLPRWAYGFLLSPQAYSTEAELNDAIQKYRELGIPVEDKTTNNSSCSNERAITAQANDPKNINIAAYEQLKPKFEEFSASDSRVVFDTHVNVPGIQKYGAISLAGDVSHCWEGLQSQVISSINATLTGQAHWSTTLGGVKTNANCTTDNMNELMLRWYQYAAFTPVFQGSPEGFEVWKLGNESSAEFQAVKKAITLRYQLLPYIYSQANKVNKSNDFITGSLLFNFKDDEKLHEVSQQFMFGPSLMVCPVIKTTNTINVTFPAEITWIDFWTGKSYNGGTSASVNTSLDYVPLFVKQGSILPMATLGNSALDNLNAPIEIRIYGGADADFILYEDENDGKGYLAEAYSKIAFNYSEKNKTLSIGSPEGEYPGQIVNRTFKVILVSEEDGVGITPAKNPQVIEYKGKKVKVKFE